MTTLVSGGFGMLGSAAVRELVGMGEQVVVLGRSDHRERLRDLEGQYAVEIADLTDPCASYEALIRHGVDRVCHVAAALTSGAVGDPRSSYRGNVVATVNLLAAATAISVRRFVHASSKAVYAKPTGAHASPSYDPVPEDYRREPSNLYGATKLAAELMVEQYARQCGLSVAVLRFGTTFGPGKSAEKYGAKADISRIIEAAVRRQPAVIEDTGERTDCIYVDDIGRGIACAALSDRSGYETYNIATGAGVTLAEVLAAVEAATPGTGVELVPTTPDPTSDRRFMVFDVRKAEQHLGFRARISLAEAIDRYAKAFGEV